MGEANGTPCLPYYDYPDIKGICVQDALTKENASSCAEAYEIWHNLGNCEVGACSNCSETPNSDRSRKFAFPLCKSPS